MHVFLGKLSQRQTTTTRDSALSTIDTIKLSQSPIARSRMNVVGAYRDRRLTFTAHSCWDEKLGSSGKWLEIRPFRFPGANIETGFKTFLNAAGMICFASVPAGVRACNWFHLMSSDRIKLGNSLG
jgi:hypothetical protein